MAFIEIKPKSLDIQILDKYVSNPKLEKEIIQTELEKKLKLYKDSVSDLNNNRNSLKLYCEQCIEDKIFCSNCNIDFLRIRIERVLERCY